MNIRKGKTSDISAITEVIRRSYFTVAKRYGLTPENCPKHPSNCSSEWVENDISRGVKYFVAESDDEIVGCVAYEKASEQTCYLERLAVVPEKRRQGRGLELVTHMLNETEALGFQIIGIGIIAHQHDLKKWYERIGFIETGRKTFGHLPFEVAFMEYRTNVFAS